MTRAQELHVNQSRARLDDARGRVRSAMGALLEEADLALGMGQDLETTAGQMTPPPSCGAFLATWAELWQAAGHLAGARRMAELGEVR